MEGYIDKIKKYCVILTLKEGKNYNTCDCKYVYDGKVPELINKLKTVINYKTLNCNVKKS